MENDTKTEALVVETIEESKVEAMPDVLSEVHCLKLQMLTEKKTRLETQLKLIESNYSSVKNDIKEVEIQQTALANEINQKYNLGDSASINITSGAIVRGVKPPTA